jgi:hypothetical protein
MCDSIYHLILVNSNISREDFSLRGYVAYHTRMDGRSMESSLDLEANYISQPALIEYLAFVQYFGSASGRV